MGLLKLSAKKIEEAKKKPLPMTAYPQEQNTGHRMSDAIFNWIVNRYKTLRNPWKASDNIIWKGACYTIPEFFGIILFFAIFWLLIKFSNDKYGDMRTLHFLILVAIFRLNVMIKQMLVLNKKF